VLSIGLSTIHADEPMFQLGVRATFDNRGMQVLSVVPQGPATRLSNKQFATASLESNDVIEQIDGKPIRSRDDLIGVLNASLDGYLTIRVRDGNSGRSSEWEITADPTAKTPYEFARDTYRRGVRAKLVPANAFVFRALNQNQFVMSNLGSVLNPLMPDRSEKDGKEQFKRLMIGVASVREHEASAQSGEVFTPRLFAACDEVLSSAYVDLNRTQDAQQQIQIAEEARKAVDRILRASMTQWCQRNGKKYVEEATVPRLVSFRVRASIPGARVDLLLAADKVLTLRNNNLRVRPVDDAGKRILDSSAPWQPLPPEEAAAYGRYYYRLVYHDGANLVSTPFDEQRLIVIAPASKGYLLGDPAGVQVGACRDLLPADP
jgi:hypothetical protein